MKKFASVLVFLFTICVIFSAFGCSNSAGGGGSSGGGQNTSGTTVTITINSNPTNITYNLNGGAGGSGEFNICTDNNGTLNNSITKEGYTFGGWYTTPDFSGAQITKITEDTTLYAKWTPITYKVEFNANGASGTMAPQTFTYGVAQPLAEKAFTKTGYNFAGWAKGQTGSAEYKDKQSVANLASTNNATVTLYAVWVVEGSYSITYNLNGGTNAATNPGTYNVETETITLAAPTKTGHTFEGWYKEDSFATKVMQIAKGSTGNITLYAKWEAKTITLTLNLDGGSGTATLSGKYGTAVTAPTAPTKSGYDFTGWTPPLPATFTADATYTAQWNAVATEEVCIVVTLDKMKAVNTGAATTDLDRTKFQEICKKEGTTLGKVKKVIIEDGVTRISAEVFMYGTALESVTIPDSVTFISSTVFYGCTALKSVTIPDSVTYIGYSAFEDCSALESVTISNSVTKIDNKTFSGCYSLKSVTIPDSVTSIGYSAFSGCTALKSVTIPDSVTYIGYRAFSGCFALESVTIPDSVTSIGEYAFCNCYSLTSITIPNSVTAIGKYAFGTISLSSSKLESVEFKDTSNWAAYEYSYSPKRYLPKITNLSVENTTTNAEQLCQDTSTCDGYWCPYYLFKGDLPAKDPFAH